MGVKKLAEDAVGGIGRALRSGGELIGDSLLVGIDRVPGKTAKALGRPEARGMTINELKLLLDENKTDEERQAEIELKNAQRDYYLAGTKNGGRGRGSGGGASLAKSVKITDELIEEIPELADTKNKFIDVSKLNDIREKKKKINPGKIIEMLTQNPAAGSAPAQAAQKFVQTATNTKTGQKIGKTADGRWVPIK